MKKIIFTILALLLLNTSHLKAQVINEKLVSQIHQILDECSYLEVSEEMFKAIAEDERYKELEAMAYIKQINYVVFVECKEEESILFDEFANEVELGGYNTLMRSKDSLEKFTFYRKINGNIKEYLLIHNEGVVYIVTSLNISNLNELQDIVKMVSKLGRG